MDFAFTWQTFDADGKIESVCEQKIFGENLSAACAYFESFHGSLADRQESGVSVKITSLKESNQ